MGEYIMKEHFSPPIHRYYILQWFIFGLSVIGIGIALYLTSVHYETAPLLCSTSGFIDCGRVINSAYSLIPLTDISITIPGLFWSIIMGIIALVLALGISPFHRLLLERIQVWVEIPAALAVLYLLYAEIVLLHAICVWCTAFHVVIICTFGLSLISYTILPRKQKARIIYRDIGGGG